MKNSYDAIVIGDGIFGLLFAYQLNITDPYKNEYP